ncbi:hypothetical protein K502DRAFT_366923 [Neoconidiobolus thromboides FSU 785]|nr:hypothetical protein K502DRAFT_366923 [Neoconidiobolus thromboides FSU 785]
MADLATSLVVDIIMFLLSFVAIGCSGLVFYISIFRNGIRGADFLPIIIMCTLDSLMGISWIVFDFMKWISNYEIMHDENIACQIQAVISLGVLEASIDCATILAILRFVVIILQVKINKIYFNIATVAMVSLSITLAIVSGSYKSGRVMPTNSYCELITLADIPFNIFYSKWLLVRIFLLPIVIAVCYGGILIKYINLLRNLKLLKYSYYVDQNFDNANNTKSYTEPVRNIKRSITALAIGIVAYIIVFAPSYITNIVQDITNADNREVWVDAIVVISIMSIILINPIFALLVHDETKVEMEHLFGKWKLSSSPNLSSYNLA